MKFAGVITPGDRFVFEGMHRERVSRWRQIYAIRQNMSRGMANVTESVSQPQLVSQVRSPGSRSQSRQIFPVFASLKKEKYQPENVSKIFYSF